MDILCKTIIRHEGLRLKPYRDTVGKLTIGVGRNLDDCGISEREALDLLENDLIRCESQLHQQSWYFDLNEVRQGVLIELTFNIGFEKVLKFEKMIAALTEANYSEAAKELLDSAWAKQVGPARANNMAKRLSTGSYT